LTFPKSFVIVAEAGDAGRLFEVSDHSTTATSAHSAGLACRRTAVFSFRLVREIDEFQGRSKRGLANPAWGLGKRSGIPAQAALFDNRMRHEGGAPAGQRPWDRARLARSKSGRDARGPRVRAPSQATPRGAAPRVLSPVPAKARPSGWRRASA
jgi:hypothetical protein